jgi:phosphoenolpyruvate phosphomutase
VTKAKVFKDLLKGPKVTYAIEAHNAASALIGERAGFKALWGSGLTLSASLGHRDCNELSWTDLCDQFEHMADATQVPILIDGDTGFGNFNNVRMLVRKLGKLGISGVCLEDKVFPKTNSFLPYNQVLAPIDEFTGKIRAAKDTQTDPDFCVVARTEALIGGLGLEEALKRAHAYKEAGADAILVHSKKTTAEEIIAFCQCWNRAAPLVIVPTTYGSTSSKLYEQLGISLVIWANHLFRASLKAMHQTAAKIFRDCSVAGIENEVASLNDIFDLVNESELKKADLLYL